MFSLILHFVIFRGRSRVFQSDFTSRL
uniref:Uncharacterized protein n=1 Tax=Anguilla anguilla TaxID=7936 RepID=A0A0E9QLB3_ANGAN